MTDPTSESVPTPAGTALSADQYGVWQGVEPLDSDNEAAFRHNPTYPEARLLATVDAARRASAERIAALEGALRRAETAMDNFFAATDHYIWNEHDLQYLRAVTAARAALGSSAKAVSGAEPDSEPTFSCGCRHMSIGWVACAWHQERLDEAIRQALQAAEPRVGAVSGAEPVKRERTDWSNVVVDEGDEAP